MSKKKILLIPDVPNWAYDIIAANTKRYSKRYAYDIVYESKICEWSSKLNFEDYDLVYWFYWANIEKYKTLIPGLDRRKVVVGIHSYNSWDKRNMTAKAVVKYCQKYAGIIVPSKTLGRDLGLSNAHVAHTGFSPKIFRPLRTAAGNGFMWVGNTSEANHGNIKGYSSVIKPVFDSATDLRLITQTRDNQIKNHEMPSFYKQGSYLICASKSEGGPMPVLEALACGIPVLSTSVGWSKYLIEDGKNGYIFDGTKADLRRKIDLILSQEYGAMSLAASNSVKKYSWPNIIHTHEEIFEEYL